MARKSGSKRVSKKDCLSMPRKQWRKRHSRKSVHGKKHSVKASCGKRRSRASYRKSKSPKRKSGSKKSKSPKRKSAQRKYKQHLTEEDCARAKPKRNWVVPSKVNAKTGKLQRAYCGGRKAKSPRRRTVVEAVASAPEEIIMEGIYY